MKTILLSALMVAFAGAGRAETADEAAVRAAHQAFVDAAKTGDRPALEKLLADGVQYSHSNTKLENKQEAIAALVKTHANYEVLAQTIHVYGKAATIRAKMTAHSETGDVPLTMLQVWVKNGANWQLVERHTTRIPAQ